MIMLSGGLLSLITGVILNLTVWLISMSHLRTLLHEISTVFYVVTLPFLLLGSHFLDLLEKRLSVLRS